MATFVVSGFYFSENSLYIRHVRQAMLDSKMLEARKNLLVASCPAKYEEDVCKFLSAHLTDKDLFDLKNFIKAYQKEFSKQSFIEIRTLVTWLSDDRIDKKLRNTEYAGVPEYQAYVDARETYLKKSLETSKADHVFIRGNAKIVASLKAMMTHEGWVHLVGNMVIFALFAVFLEQRIGFFGLMVLYTLGGLGSNYLQLPFLPMGVRLFGASGAVSAAIGAFAVYFWREKMRCLMSVGFVYNRMILMPAWLYIGLFLLLSDVVGMVGAGSGVAHLAHLTGFLIGFIFAYMQMDLFPLKKSFLFAQEQNLYYEAKEAEVVEEKIAIFRRIYSVNKESFYAFRGLFIYLNKQNFHLASFSKEDLAFVTELVQSCLAYKEKNEKYDLAREIVGMIPLSWNLSMLEMKLGPGEIIDRAEQFQAEGDIVQSLRFYDLFFVKYAAHVKAPEIKTQIMRIFDKIEKLEHEVKAQILEVLLVYADHHPDNHFQTQLRQLIHQVHKGERSAAS
ncbi:rhomboid family intramembrane serine protease [Bdellovibrio sp. HCB337]|uniref:rhomboid family intramembrane serine protease n=1 Tax=Bdellovibrio sp. HCB337 TaxID=3394358 RepID=UPI0039A57899